MTCVQVLVGCMNWRFGLPSPRSTRRRKTLVEREALANRRSWWSAKLPSSKQEGLMPDAREGRCRQKLSTRFSHRADADGSASGMAPPPTPPDNCGADATTSPPPSQETQRESLGYTLCCAPPHASTQRLVRSFRVPVRRLLSHGWHSINPHGCNAGRPPRRKRVVLRDLGS